MPPSGRELGEPVIPILNSRTEWTCPNCTQVEVTNDPRPHTRFHSCPGLKGLTAPYVVAGTRCKVEAVEREDYVGNELVRYTEDGIPVSFVKTTRDDGCDVIAFPATARATFGAHGV